MRGMRLLSLLSALALGLGTATAAEKPVALIIAQGGLGDQSYNDLAYAGFKQAIAATTPASSASSAQATACRARWMPTAPKYTAST